jgi:D-glycero-alpha-D-manno-heptose-7-phosphate kinase
VIVAQAPFRVSLFGGGSDFPEHFNEHGGAVVGGSINRFCFVTVRARPQSFGTKFRVRYSKVDEATDALGVDHPVVRQLLQDFQIDYPLDLNHSSDLPARSGIGSSSAFLAAVYAGLSPQSVSRLSPYELSNELSRIERGQLMETCGLQDSIFAVFGGFNLIEFSNAGFLVRQSIASRAYLNTLANHCFLIYLGNERLSSSQQQGLLRRIPQSNTVLTELAQIARETFGEINREVLEPQNLGARISAGWELKKESSPSATTKDIDALHDELKRLGAWGGKILGAGGGGFYLAVASSDVRRRFEELHSDTVTCGFEWDFSGLTVRRV